MTCHDVSSMLHVAAAATTAAAASVAAAASLDHFTLALAVVLPTGDLNPNNIRRHRKAKSFAAKIIVTMDEGKRVNLFYFQPVRMQPISEIAQQIMK